MRASRLLAFSLAPLLAGCISLNYISFVTEEPIADERVAALKPDRDDLTSCLRALGAPTLVWELPNGGVAVSYGWINEAHWGFSISLPIPDFDFQSASFDYDDEHARTIGFVLIFDGALVLRIVRRGYLRDITGDLKRPPAEVDG